MGLSSELERRYANTRAAMAEHDLDALIVSGTEYTGFEGSVTYLSGFQIVHRYAYVVVPADGDPLIVFPSEARYVGEHGTAEIEQVFAGCPGEEIAARAKAAGWKRIGVYGLDYIMTVRDYAPSRASTSSTSTSSSTTRARSRAMPSSSPSASRCASTSAGSRSSSSTTLRAGRPPR